MSEHHEHQAGTVSGCRACTELAYEPSWYASLLSFAKVRDPRSAALPVST